MSDAEQDPFKCCMCKLHDPIEADPKILYGKLQESRRYEYRADSAIWCLYRAREAFVAGNTTEGLTLVLDWVANDKAGK